MTFPTGLKNRTCSKPPLYSHFNGRTARVARWQSALRAQLDRRNPYLTEAIIFGRQWQTVQRLRSSVDTSWVVSEDPEINHLESFRTPWKCYASGVKKQGSWFRSTVSVQRRCSMVAETFLQYLGKPSRSRSKWNCQEIKVWCVPTSFPNINLRWPHLTRQHEVNI